MHEQELDTQTLKAADARQQRSQQLSKLFRKKTRALVEMSRIPVAAIVSVDDLIRLQQLDAERGTQFKALDAVRHAFKDVPPEELEREVARANEVSRQRHIESDEPSTHGQ